jgi:uncharacterized protein YkwD
MSRRLAIPVICLLLMGLTACGGGGGVADLVGGGGGGDTWVMATAPDTSPGAVPGTGMSPQEEAMVLACAQWTNGHRIANGLSPLTWAPNVAAVADGHAVTMATLGVMSHTAGGTTLGQRLAAGGIQYLAAGENIAWNYLTGQLVAEGWMNSDGHRANILGNFTQIGLAVRDFGGGPYWCMVLVR